MIIDALGYMLEDTRYGIEGFRLPDGSEVKDIEYADDANLYLLGTVENLNRTYKVLSIFFALGRALE